MKLSELREKAELGDAEAQYELGLSHLNGYRMSHSSPSIENATEWFKKSAKQGNNEALRKLWELAEEGIEYAQWKLVELAEREVDGTADELTRMAEEGNELALWKLAGMAKDGVDEAISGLKYLAMTGNSRSSHLVGKMYLTGKGVEHSVLKATVWFETAARQGSDDAWEELEKLAAEGSSWAMDAIKNLASDGIKATKLHTKTAEKDDEDTQRKPVIPIEKDDDWAKRNLLKRVEVKIQESKIELKRLEAEKRQREDLQNLVKPTYEKADKQFASAARTCNEDALKELAILAEKDDECALEKLVELAEGGDSAALGELVGLANKGFDEALETLAMLAEDGVEEAIEAFEDLTSLDYGSPCDRIYGSRLGWGGPCSSSEAAGWFGWAVEAGDEGDLERVEGGLEELIELTEDGYDEALEEIIKLAERGFDGAQEALVELAGRDVDGAQRWLEQSAADINYRGSNNNTIWFYLGESVRMSYEDAAEWLARKAETREDIDLKSVNGDLKERLKIAEYDVTKAVMGLFKLAEEGNDKALDKLKAFPRESHAGYWVLNFIDRLYIQNWNVPEWVAELLEFAVRDRGWEDVKGAFEDVEEVLYVLEDVALENDDKSLYKLISQIYLDEEAYEDSAEWLAKAAEAGDEEALWDLAELVENGDENALLELWLLNLRTESYSLISLLIGSIFLEGNDAWRPDRDEADEWFSKAAKGFGPAAEQGSAEAQYNLGVMLLNGYGVKQSDKKAARMFRMSANQGNAEAQYMLSMMLLARRDAECPGEQAIDLLRKAAKGGVPEAIIELERIEAERRKRKTQRTSDEAVHERPQHRFKL